MPKLLLKFGPAVIKEIVLASNEVMVGRREDCDVVIDNPAVSGRHCRIFKEGEGYFVEDLNSTNGTYINQKKILKAGLHHEDRVDIAKHALVFLSDPPPVEIAPPAVKGAVAEPTVVLTVQQQKNIAAHASMASLPMAGVRILQGVVDHVEHELKGPSTYIGKSDKAQIKVKAGFFAPEIVAMISRQPDGYKLVALQEGYPKVNGTAIQERWKLEDGDIIEVGSTKMQFFLKKIILKNA